LKVGAGVAADAVLVTIYLLYEFPALMIILFFLRSSSLFSDAEEFLCAPNFCSPSFLPLRREPFAQFPYPFFDETKQSPGDEN